MEYLLLLAPVLVAFAAGAFDNDDHAEPEPEPEPEPPAGDVTTLTEGDDDLTISDPDFHGLILGLGGDDRISVATDDHPDHRVFPPSEPDEGFHVSIPEAPDDPVYRYDPDRPEAPPSDRLTIVDGGAGDDHITVSGTDIWVEGGEGRDHIDASGLISGGIHAGTGDTVILGDAARNVEVYGRDFTLHGGAADVSATGLGAVSFFGGEGDDYLAATGDGALLDGGAGHDTLDGAYNTYRLLPTHNSGFGDMIGAGSDRLIGGDGNDVIRFDHADTVTGGEGADLLRGFLQPGETALVTDFDPAEDRAEIQVQALSPDRTAGGITLERDGADSLLLLDGSPILRLADTAGLQIAVNLRADPFGDNAFVDLNGDPVDPAIASVVIGQHVVAL